MAGDLLSERWRLKPGERVQVRDLNSKWKYRIGEVRRDLVRVVTVKLDDGLGTWPFNIEALERVEDGV